ncbi:sortase [Candidatus Saccharibacteria bacterium]|nr:sortase [Candidatus Saccharibacteria bacterium]
MELKRKLSPKTVFVGLYFLFFAVYLIIGLRPAEAVQYEISSKLTIPSIGLVSGVTTLELRDGKLDTPDTIVGSFSNAENKTFLIGHSTTVFKELHKVKLNEILKYNDKSYRVTSIDMLEKAKISMSEILSSTEKDTIIIMTCAGELLDGGDATHRLLIKAVSE